VVALKPCGPSGRQTATLHRLFTEAGCRDDRLTEQAVKGTKVPNVVCILPGMTDTRIVIGAHFDKVRRGMGVADNWSGASLLPSLFESLRNQVRRHTMVFVGFTDEEMGLVGSRFFVRSLTREQAACIKRW
jgi:Zn-dependent M28 family amino/carboxypeptidase